MQRVTIEARGLVKRFPGVVALSGVDFGMRGGEVHALVGANGAGKSTLIKIVSGFHAADEGVVLVDGAPLEPSTAAARAAGIATIHQEHNLVPSLSVAENVLLGGWAKRFGLISKRRLREHASRALAQVAPQISPSRTAQSLSTAEGQLVEIARALAQGARVVIMDEPTTALTEHDVERLFRLVRELRGQRLAILYVSHRLEEVFALADRVTVLRDGSTVSSGSISNFDTRSLVREMVGEDIELYSPAQHEPGEGLLECRGLGRRGAFAGVSFSVRAGEIHGLAGLVGAGRSEVARCVFGADPLDEGEIRLAGRRLVPRGPFDAVRAGIGLLPEDRKRQGLVPELTVRENIGLGQLDQLTSRGLLRLRVERELATDYIRKLDIRTSSTEARVSGLSGGNQQKTVLARWLARNPRVLLLDEPTKGVDVGAKAEIHRLIEGLAGSGVAVVLISSELPELLELSDRVTVMREGRVVTTLSRSEATRESVMSHAAG